MAPEQHLSGYVPRPPPDTWRTLVELPGVDLIEVPVPGTGSCFWEALAFALDHKSADQLRATTAGGDPSVWADPVSITETIRLMGCDPIFVYPRDTSRPLAHDNIRAYCGVRGCPGAHTMVLIHWVLHPTTGQGQHFNAIAIRDGNHVLTSIRTDDPLAQRLSDLLYSDCGDPDGVDPLVYDGIGTPRWSCPLPPN